MHNLTKKHEAAVIDWKYREANWIDEIAANGTKIEEIEQDLQSKVKLLNELQSAKAAAEQTISEPADEIKIVS